MASLQSIIKQSKGFEQVAAQVKNVAMFKSPRRTGNLRRKLNEYNRPKSMVEFGGSAKKPEIKISLNVGPSGAEYGRWFNDPPRVIKRTKLKATAERKGNWDFGKEAFKDNSVKNEVKKLVKELGPEIAEYFRDIIKL
jgi:hypothetical protein